MSPTEARVWFVIFSGMGLGFVGFGVTFVRHAQSSSADVPAGAPFIDHFIWIASVVCVLGGLCLMAALLLPVEPIRERLSRQRQTGPTDT